MKNTIVLFFLFAFLSNVHAQTTSKITEFESDNLSISQDVSKNTFQITSKTSDLVFSNLKYVGSVGDSYQVIDANNEIFLLDAVSLKKKDKAKNLYWLCGTVPHYTIAVEETKDSFVITKDETFYDMMGKEAAKEVMKISKSDADSIVFINGKNSFDFSSNFSYSSRIINPMTVFLVKDGKYSVSGEKPVKYDSIDFEGYSPTLKYSVGDLHGFHNITEAKYSKVSDFQDNLARVTTAEGKEIIIDVEGNEYF